MNNYENYIRFDRVDSVEETPTGLAAALHGERLRVDVVSEDVVRIKISRGGVFDEQPTFAVCSDTFGEGVLFRVERTEGVVRLETSRLVVSLWTDPFRIDVHREDGSAVFETARDSDGRYAAYSTLNDAFALARKYRPDDAIYGLGEKTGRQNRKGRAFTLWNTDVLSPTASGEFTADLNPADPRADPTSTEFDPYYVSIPFYYHQDKPSGKIAASFIDNGYRGHYDFRDASQYRVHFSGGQYTEYVFAGPDMPGILEAYTWLTGRVALPPLWSLGYHQCRWHDYSQGQIEALARKHRELDIPCDALWLDIEYMDGYRVFTWNRDLFPDVDGMLQRLGDDGFRLITIIDPGVKHEPGYPIFDEAVERDVLCRTEGGDIYIGQVWPGNTAFPDFVTEEGRTWWGELNAKHVQSGLAGIWNDMNEPATGDISALSMRFGRGQHPHERFHNQYAMLMAMGTTAGLLKAMPNKRTFVLSRAGSAGIQRYAANWMGDNMARWDHLAMSIPMGTGFGISGQAFLGADIGGFANDTNPELYARWMQYGALTPFCRNHSMGAVEQYAWTFGETVLRVAREALRLRYRLMPYLYSAFVRASETGAPVQQPLVFDYQYDAIVGDIDDEYLFGSDLLVAPVLEAGTTARQVYLPAGRWYDWHTGAVEDGQRYVLASTPMDRIPIYARGGAVVPMWEEAPASTDGYAPTSLELHLFIPADDGKVHESFLQEDDGLTFEALDGARHRTNFSVSRTGDRVAVVAETEGGGYEEFSRTHFSLVIHGGRPETAYLNGAEVSVTEERLIIPNHGEGFRVEFDV